MESNRLLAEAEKELAMLDARREILLEQIKRLRHEGELINQTSSGSSPFSNKPAVTSQSLDDEKISLFRALFRGREDVYAKRFESVRTGKSYNIPMALERSRSGKGGHVWIFFSEPVPAMLARKMGSFILTETMEYRPQIGLDSYDRFFPSQDTLPKGSFGNLIALPLQKKPSEEGNSVFLDENFVPYPDQWAFLSSIRRMNRNEVQTIVDEAVRLGRVIGVRMSVTDENVDDPWTAPPSRQWKESPVTGPLPEQLALVLGNQIYVAKEELPPALINRLIRLAAFQNPEFYKAQAMRFPTFNKPRIISCCEDFPKHIGIPRGCLDEVVELLRSLKIKLKIIDERCSGAPIDLRFCGNLRLEQQMAAKAMLS